LDVLRIVVDVAPLVLAKFAGAIAAVYKSIHRKSKRGRRTILNTAIIIDFHGR
jgi:hypothetical protein